MVIDAMTEQECAALLTRVSLGRLGCSFDDQPYVVPISFAYEPGYIYALSTFGQKIEWMRQNPKVCLEVEEAASESEWITVIATGTYQELTEPQYSAELAHARKILGKRRNWWQIPLAERQAAGEDLVSPLFFRIHIDSITGLRASH
jgi:nitroimidazol reductase NimA-like FMN-containing flavoprotein (pyridoxamine 5'-phosphate oxidase superfamily)